MIVSTLIGAFAVIALSGLAGSCTDVSLPSQLVVIILSFLLSSLLMLALITAAAAD